MKAPEITASRRAWNSSEEKKINKIFGTAVPFKAPPHRPLNLLDQLPDSVYQAIVSDDAQAQNTLVQKQSIAVLQLDLSRKVSRRFAEDDFEEVWQRKCTPSEREAWLLEGLQRTCDASPDFEDSRMYCPESTLARCNHQSGKGFLNLLTQLIHQDISTVPDDYRMVPNLFWESMNCLNKAQTQTLDPGRRMFQRMNSNKRTYFLTMFVWNTLLAFYGESQTYGLQKTTRGAKEERPFPEDKNMRRVWNETLKESSAQRASAERGCTTCGLPAAKAGVASLMACQRCKAIGRDVFYCSKDCQVKDWKHGNPTHKSICGNKSALLDLVLSSSSSKGETKPKDDDIDNEWPGPPEPGFVRSPALLHQLKFLKENPSLDYVFVRPYPEPDQGVKLVDPMGVLMFKIMFKRAACRPAPAEVARMYNFLEPSAVKMPRIGREGLKKQLFKEYGVDVDEINKILDQQNEERRRREGTTAEEEQRKVDKMYADLLDSTKGKGKGKDVSQN